MSTDVIEPMKVITMKMARATEQDMDAALLLNGMLEDIDGGQYPRGLDGGFDPEDPDFFDEDDGEHCRVFVKRVLAILNKQCGCMNRVIWGMSTALHNNVFDNNKDTLEWHPTLVAAVEARRSTQEAEC